MKIESAVYRVLYKYLCDKIEKEIYKGNPPNFKSENRAELFKTKKNGQTIGKRLLKESEVNDERYVYRQVTALNIDTIRGEFNPQVLYNILTELGYVLDEKYIESDTIKKEAIQDSKAGNLLDQFKSMHPADIREEQNKVDPAYYIDSPNADQDKIETSNAGAEEPEFLKAVQVISNFYAPKKHVITIDDLNPDRFEFLFWGSSDCDFEIRQFNKFKSTLDTRNSILGDSNPFGYIKQALEFSFLKNVWSLYELQGDKIIERKIQFLITGNRKENKYLHPTGIFCNFKLFEEDNQTQSSYYCLMDFLHRSIQISGGNNLEGNKKYIYFNFSYLEDNWTLDRCIGHKITFQSERQTFESKVVALCKKRDEKYYNAPVY